MESRAESRSATVEVFFNTLGQPACINGFKGQFLAVNAAFTAALGWTEDDLRDLAYYDLVAAPERKSMLKLGALIVRHAGGDPRVYRRAFRHKDGSYRVVEWTAWADAKANVVCATGRVLGVAGTR